MKELTAHTVLPSTEEPLTITVVDEPSHGGASHHYSVSWMGKNTDLFGKETPGYQSSYIHFQEGPVKEHGVNGITETALLAILLDRYIAFQSGPYASERNEKTIFHLDQALQLQHERTRERMTRNVEGTSTK